ncbi:MAG: hypothetical protein V2A54_16495 [Bacteroidota bacterium]
MKKIPFLLFVLFSCCIFISCDKNATNPAFEDIPVVEGYLFEGGFVKVKISRQVPYSSEATYSEDDINNLLVSVLKNQQSFTLASSGNGLYLDSTLNVQFGNTYEMHFIFNGKEVIANTTIPTKPVGYTQSVTEIVIEPMDTNSMGPPSMPDPVELNWTNNDASYYLVVVENKEQNPVLINELGDDEDVPSRVFRNQPTQLNTSKVQSRNFKYYGMHRLILYHIHADYAALYDVSNTSSQNLSNPSSDITNAYGIFTGLNSDTLYINVKSQ